MNTIHERVALIELRKQHRRDDKRKALLASAVIIFGIVAVIMLG